MLNRIKKIAKTIVSAKALPIGTIHGDWKKISRNKWKYISHGHQGHVYEAHDGSNRMAVKVSKQSTFTGDGKKSPKEAREDILREHSAIEDLSHNPLVPKKYGTWRKGKKVFMAREYLKPIQEDIAKPLEKLDKKELDYVRDQIWDMFESGYRPTDHIQLGRDKDNKLKIMDMGGFDKAAPGQRHMDIGDVKAYLRVLYRFHDQHKEKDSIPTKSLKHELKDAEELKEFMQDDPKFLETHQKFIKELKQEIESREQKEAA